MMDEIMRQEERILLNQIAKLTEEGHLAWDCVEYNPIGFLDKDEYSEQSACICQMFQFEAAIGGLHMNLSWQNISMCRAVKWILQSPSPETMKSIL